MKKLKITDYFDLVGSQASAINKRTPHNVDYEDLFSAGLIGLMDAIEKYDIKKNDNFKAYAIIRIRGAIFDEIRNMSWLTRWYSIKHKRENIEPRKMVTYSKVFEREKSIVTQRWMISRSANLETAFNQLSMRERNVLRLYYYDELKMHEIADLFGISEVAISLTYRKAIGNLKLMMRAG